MSEVPQLAYEKSGAAAPGSKAIRRQCAGPPQTATPLIRSFPQLAYEAKKAGFEPGQVREWEKAEGGWIQPKWADQSFFFLSVILKSVSTVTSYVPSAHSEPAMV